MTLLRQNAELKRDHVWQFSLPAWVTRLPDGRTINVCPQAGACVKLCYARNGTFNFPVVKASHQRNLLLAMDHQEDFISQVNTELEHRRFHANGVPRLPDLSRSHLSPFTAALLDNGAACIRIHDSGDFFSDDYLAAWLRIAQHNPSVLFYAYTKEVTRFRHVISLTNYPRNFLWVYSLGGKEDHLLDLAEGGDRHADVFPNEAAIVEAGYYSQDANDLLCVLAPSTRIGIPTNNIPHFKKRQGGMTFGQLEAETKRHRRANA